MRASCLYKWGSFLKVSGYVSVPGCGTPPFPANSNRVKIERSRQSWYKGKPSLTTRVRSEKGFFVQCAWLLIARSFFSVWQTRQKSRPPLLGITGSFSRTGWSCVLGVTDKNNVSSTGSLLELAASSAKP